MAQVLTTTVIVKGMMNGVHQSRTKLHNIKMKDKTTTEALNDAISFWFDIGKREYKVVTEYGWSMHHLYNLKALKAAIKNAFNQQRNNKPNKIPDRGNVILLFVKMKKYEIGIRMPLQLNLKGFTRNMTNEPAIIESINSDYIDKRKIGMYFSNINKEKINDKRINMGKKERVRITMKYDTTYDVNGILYVINTWLQHNKINVPGSGVLELTNAFDGTIYGGKTNIKMLVQRLSDIDELDLEISKNPIKIYPFVVGQLLVDLYIDTSVLYPLVLLSQLRNVIENADIVLYITQSALNDYLQLQLDNGKPKLPLFEYTTIIDALKPFAKYFKATDITAVVIDNNWICNKHWGMMRIKKINSCILKNDERYKLDATNEYKVVNPGNVWFNNPNYKEKKGKKKEINNQNTRPTIPTRRTQVARMGNKNSNNNNNDNQNDLFDDETDTEMENKIDEKESKNEEEKEKKLNLFDESDDDDDDDNDFDINELD